MTHDGFRMHSASASTSAIADVTSREASSSPSAPPQEMMQTNGDFVITVSPSSVKRLVSVRDGESSRDHSRSPPSQCARRGAAGSEAARGLSGTSTMGGPSTVVYVPSPPPLPPPSIPTLLPIPAGDCSTQEYALAVCGAFAAGGTIEEVFQRLLASVPKPPPQPPPPPT